MGTQDPLVHIEAATLAGGDKNQDRYAYGDDWAFVLDGASSFNETPPLHDGGWYAERLKQSLAARLTGARRLTTREIVAEAILESSEAHDEAAYGPCPTSTIALARWDADGIELYVLGDSCAAVASPSGQMSVLLQDLRIDDFGSEAREAYRARLRNGGGFDRQHQQLLRALQCQQSRGRNRLGGFWVAGSVAESANHAYSARVDVPNGKILLFTDGLTQKTEAVQACQDLISCVSIETYLRLLHNQESDEQSVIKFPRSKLHDDKTVITVDFGSNASPMPSPAATRSPLQ